MGKFLYLSILLAGLDPTYEEASDQARRALLETQMMKDELVQLQGEAERHLYYYTGLTKDDLIYAAYLYPMASGKLSSKPFKNFKYETQNHWSIRPEIEYGIYNKESTTSLIITKEF